jgi:hypothetical protein
VTVLNTGKSRSEFILEGHVVKDTRKLYERNLVYITSYCRSHIPDACSPNGELIIPMELQHLESFLGEMTADREDDSCKTPSTIGGYVSALKFYYKEMLWMMIINHAKCLSY